MCINVFANGWNMLILKYNIVLLFVCLFVLIYLLSNQSFISFSFSYFLIISIYLSYLLFIQSLLSSHYFNFLWIFSLIGFLPIPFFCKKLAKKKCIFQNSLLFSFVFLQSLNAKEFLDVEVV